MIDLTKLMNAVIALAAALITTFLIPWIKAHTKEKTQQTIRDLIHVAVFAAEQMFGNGHGAEKMKYVREYLNSKGYDVDIEEIEAVVGEYLNFLPFKDEEQSEPGEQEAE